MGCCFELVWGLQNRSPVEVIKEGMQAGRAAIELDPSNDEAHGNLGFLLWASGEHEIAARETTAAIELNPNNTWAHIALGVILDYSGPEHYENAMQKLRYSIRFGPRDVAIHWTHIHLATASFVSKKYGDTIEFAQTALRHDPKNATAYRYIAAALACEGRIDEAKETWKKSNEMQTLDWPNYVGSVNRMYKKDSDAQNYLQALRLASAPID